MESTYYRCMLLSGSIIHAFKHKVQVSIRSICTYSPHSLYTGDVTIRFEYSSYYTYESVGVFLGIRLVVSNPFANNASVNISFEDITAKGQLVLRIYSVGLYNSW